MPKPIGERMAAAEEQLESLDREMLRVRTRLHDLEAERAAIKLLIEQQRQLADRIGQVANSIPEIAKHTAEQTVAILVKDHRAIQTVREDQRREKTMVRIQAVIAGASLGAVVTSVTLALTHTHL